MGGGSFLNPGDEEALAAAAMPTLAPGSRAPAGAQPPAPGTPQEYNWLQGFASSAVSAIPEMFGMNPGALGLDRDATEAWRATHPIGGFVSETIPNLVGMGGGAALGGRLIGRVMLGAAERVGLTATAQVARVVAQQTPRIAQMPLATGAVAGALELVPFEAARLGAAAVLGDEGSVGQIAGSAALDLALGSVFTGGLHWYRNAGSRDADSVMRGIVNGYDGRMSAQEKLGMLLQERAAGTGTPQSLELIESRIRGLENEIRTAVPTRTDRYVDTLVGDVDPAPIDRLFRPRAVAATGPRASTDMLRRQFTVGERGFANGAEWEAIAQQAGLQDGWMANVQYPRVLDVRSPAVLTKTLRTLEKHLPLVEDGWRFGRETNSGLAIMVKELPNGRFVLFKTATPSQFIKPSLFDVLENRGMSYLQRVERPLRRAQNEELLAKVGDDAALNRTAGLQRDITPEAMDTVRRGGTVENYMNMLPEGMRQIGKEGSDLVRSTWDFIKSGIASTDALFRKAPGAAALRLIINGVQDIVNAKVANWTVGRVGVEEGKNLIWRSMRPRGGVQPLLTALSENEFQHAVRAISSGGTLDSARAYLKLTVDNPELENKIMSLLEWTSRAASETAQEIHLTEAVLRGKGRFASNEANYGFNHMWLGEHRARVLDDNGKVLGVGAGRSSNAALANARNIARETGGTVEAKSFIGNSKEDEQLLRQIRANRENIGIQGPAAREAIFRGGDAGQISKSEFYKLFEAKVVGEHKLLGDTIIREHLGGDISNVRRMYGDRVADDLEYRVRIMLGEKGIVDKAFNAVVDKALKPWIGANSASKLVQMYNKLEFSNLVFMSPGYLIQQMMAPIQTVLPGVGHLLNTNAAGWQRFMDFSPAFGLNGKPIGFQGTLAPLRLMAAAGRSIFRPNSGEARDLGRAVSEGVIRPGFIDEMAGPTSRFGQAVGEGFASGSTMTERATNGAVNLLRMFSTIPAARVEELSRAYSFMAGRHIAIARGITDEEQIFQVAKRFANRTMYQYSAADRPKIFNGPAGGMFGLFKNWVFQNINDLSLYTHEAYRHGSFQPLMLALGGQAALAGVGGTAISGVADGLSRFFTDKSLMQHLYEAHLGDGPNGHNVTDALYFGLPGFLGVSLQNQLASIGADPQQDINFLHNFVAFRRGQKISTLINYFTDQWRANGNPMASRRTWDMINYAVGPRVTYKLFSEVEDGALRSIRDGRPITEITDPQDAWINALGLQPTRIARAYEASTRLFERRAEHRAATARLGEAYARAVESGDQHAITFILRRAFETGSDVASVMRSGATRVRLHHTPTITNDFKHDPNTAPLLEALGL